MKPLLLTLISYALLTSACASSSTKKDSEEPPVVKETASSATGPGDRVTCTQDKDLRGLEIKKTKAGGCELFYTKFGTERSIATSAGSKYCAEVREKIKSNLSQSGFKCE